MRRNVRHFGAANVGWSHNSWSLWSHRRAGELLATGALAGLLLSGCSSSSRAPERGVRASNPDAKYGVSASPRLVADGQPVPKGGGSFKLGSPYRVAGRWYVPREQPHYDETGLASWYGTDFHGRKTANGEIYDMNGLTAAHKTLPLPSYVYVTNLENGRTLLLRVNDRGPYAHERILDLSRQAARLLGTEARGVARVRVRYAGRAPLDGDDRRERQFLAAQGTQGPVRQASIASNSAGNWSPALPRREAVSGAWRPTSALGVGMGAGARTFVQVGIFRDSGNVARLRRELTGLGEVRVATVDVGGATAYRVRLGPFAQAEAHDAARKIAARGIVGARVVSE